MKPAFSSAYLILLTAVFIAVTNNYPLWQILFQDRHLHSFFGAIFTLTLLIIVTYSITFFTYFVAYTKVVKPLLIFFIFFAALTSYFNVEYGVIFHLDMVRNIAENLRDQNTNEAIELISIPLLKHLLIYAFLPSLIIGFFPIQKKGLFKELKHRLLLMSLLSFFAFIIIYPNLNAIKEYGREHRNLRAYVNPIYPIASIIKYAKQQKNTAEFQKIGQDAQQIKINSHRTIGIFVVGETARADHFSLNGYQRKTNPYLEKQTLINLPNARSCGTSTIFSVPCMFSFLNRKDYSPELAAAQSNVLDVLELANVKVLWIDNNSSCKGVCARIENINYREYPDPTLPFYGHGEYFDEILLHHLKEKINATDKDILIVLHMLGSHGPAYYKRVPDTFDHFQPQCQKNTYQECRNNQEFVNAYDNTLVYSDYVLNKTIDLLKEDENENKESFMIYASDHGESLGENGLYLHGTDYASAPDAQTHIPFFTWLSKRYIDHHQINTEEVHKEAQKPHSHDNIVHTLLGLFHINTQLYDKKLDLFSTSHH